jgi:glucose-1-phosphate adenylyltransferase
VRRPTATELSRRSLAVIMAGGNGTRLRELTRWHAKPALSFGGQFRNIDFPLSNCIHSGVRRIALLTQYKAHSLIQHVQQGWNYLSPEIGEFIELWPAQQRSGGNWYEGTADAVFQNLDLIQEHDPDYILVLAGDHVYKMDYSAMLERHVAADADITVGCVEVPIDEASAYGVMSADADGWIRRFDEKPTQPEPLHGNDALALASMGIYVFSRGALASLLAKDAQNPCSRRDFGRDIIPGQIGRCRLLAYPFRDSRTGRQGYWRDVGTLDSYWKANMELLDEEPGLDLWDPAWRVLSRPPQSAPPRFTGHGTASQSIVSCGCTVAGKLDHVVASCDCYIGARSIVEHSVILPNVRIGVGCRVHRAIVDSGCVIPDGMVIDGTADDGAEHIALVTRDTLEQTGHRSRIEHMVA